MSDVFIGAEHIISGLGKGIESNFSKLSRENRSAIRKAEKAGFNQEDVYLATVPDDVNGKSKFSSMLHDCLEQIRNSLSKPLLSDDDTLFILSSTKGDINTSLTNPFFPVLDDIKNKYNLSNRPVIISNACISGVMAINKAADLIRNGYFNNVVVVGCDLISDFVLYGFQSLYAISDEPCAPYDKSRKGITLGEGAAGVVLSADPESFNVSPLKHKGGASSNDANHISGPSRTGEGLFRSVKKALHQASADAKDISFISAHGTATLYNDEMESIAFDRLGMNDIPLNSLKGYFGHTLGAAGLLETAVSMQSLRNDLLIKSPGYREKGITKPLNIIERNQNKSLHTMLKTASGFGGGNASLVIGK